MNSQPSGEVDRRFSEPDAAPTPWAETVRVLEEAELYWLTTVRADGRPHVTPLIGVIQDELPYFCTGLREHSSQVALTTGNNTWAQGLDVVVEGTARRVSDRDTLQRLADAYEAKYGSFWHFDVGDGVFLVTGADDAAVFRIEPDKVMAFAKEPHAQTT